MGGQRIGAIMQATVLSGVTPDMRIFKEENFGPVMCLMSYTSIEEALNIANLGNFGLQPAVMTHDFKKGWEVSLRKSVVAASMLAVQPLVTAAIQCLLVVSGYPVSAKKAAWQE